MADTQPVEEPWADDDAERFSVPVSAIEHYSYCPRQCALVHVEQTFDDNVYTVRGHLAHERVHSGEDDVAEGVKVLRGVRLWSERLGLSGKADVVELRREGPYPVEYKSGRRRGAHADYQLCAQAMCLEEMMGVPVPRGALFYAGVRRRHEVTFTPALRQQTERLIAEVRELLLEQRVPPPVNDARCRQCAQIDVCLPEVVAEPARLRGFQGSLFVPYEPGGS
ncbi:MAG: CRISPR-associated protein Cas4 [Chloroflexota bacterium]